MTVWFNVEKAWLYLLSYGEVYTIRPNKKVNGVHRLRSNFTQERMHCTCQFITEIEIREKGSLKQLDQYVDKSGFSSVEEWIDHIPKKKLIMRLYHVRLCDFNEK